MKKMGGVGGCQSQSQRGKDEQGKFNRGSLKSKIAISEPSGAVFFTALLHWFMFSPQMICLQCCSGFWLGGDMCVCVCLWGSGRLHHSEIKKFICEDQADREESEINCIILTHFAALDTIKKKTHAMNRTSRDHR